MKKAETLILLVFLMFSMSACSSTTTSSDSFDEAALKYGNTFVESKDYTTDEPTKNENDFISAKYKVGDIILDDGSIVKAAELDIIDSSNVPIAVIAGFQKDGTAFGVGVHKSDVPLQWASDDSAGYVTGFMENVCTQNSDFDFSGDKDGKDNWEIICTLDSKDTVNAAENYPAFHFVNTYAETYNLSGDMASGWYMPCITELCIIYQNREAINNSLRYIYGLDNKAAMNGLETNWYWSSSQSGSEDAYVWFVHYFNGYAGECPKNFKNVHVLAIRQF